MPHLAKKPMSFVDRLFAGLKLAEAEAEKLLRDSAPASQRKRMLVALSGGPDSTALIFALNQLKAQIAVELFACHVNHHMRGAESDQDQEFCANLCQTLSIPLSIKHIKEMAASESQMRDARYQQLLSAAEENQIHYVLTAHTLDDQIETILFRLFRGTGMKGLSGMSPARALANEVALLRPLLLERRAECHRFLSEHSLAARNDSSNDDLKYTRNWLRTKVLPLVQERFASMPEHVDHLRQIISAESALIEEFAQKARTKLEAEAKMSEDSWDWQAFSDLPLALRRRIVVDALTKRGIEANFDLVEKIINLDKMTALSIDGQWDIRLEKGILLWQDKLHQYSSESKLANVQVTLKPIGKTIVAPLNLAVSIEALGKEEISPASFPDKRALEALVDLSAIGGALVLRTRVPGDVICPLGMNQQVKLKKYLHTHKQDDSGQNSLAPFARAPYLLIASAEEVLWVPGIGLSDKVKVKSRPTHRLSFIKLAEDDLSVC